MWNSHRAFCCPFRWLSALQPEYGRRRATYFDIFCQRCDDNVHLHRQRQHSATVSATTKRKPVGVHEASFSLRRARPMAEHTMSATCTAPPESISPTTALLITDTDSNSTPRPPVDKGYATGNVVTRTERTSWRGLPLCGWYGVPRRQRRDDCRSDGVTATWITSQKGRKKLIEVKLKNSLRTPGPGAREASDNKPRQDDIGVMSDVISNADECARAIERALAAMDPPLEVFGGVLTLIAEFAQPWRESSGEIECCQ